MASEESVAAEAAWYKRAGIAALAGAVLAFAGFILLRVAIGGGVNFEGLEQAHDNSTLAWVSGAASFLGFSLLSLPFYRLFKATQARSSRVRGQLVGLVVIGPLLLGISGLIVGGGTQEAANSYVNNEVQISSAEVREAHKECDEELTDKGRKTFAEEFDQGSSPEAACDAKRVEEKKGSKAIKDASLITLGSFFGFAGALSLIVALFYVGLWSMRTGLLSRFWGSLGMAVGVVVLFGLTPLALVWFAYLGLVFLGAVPGGRPPAWAAGEAIPWPTAGEKIASDLSPTDPDPDVVEGEAEELPDDPGAPDGPTRGPDESADTPGNGAAPKKRKKRN